MAAFSTASAALIGIFFSSGIPIPLYNTFRVEDGITDGELALTTVAYLGVTALSLLVFGRVSNHLGRRPVVIAAVLFAVAGCLVLSQVHSLSVLILGRVLQGLACGTASTAAGAMVIDLAPRTRVQWLPAVITSSAPPFAIPLGALVSGTLVDLAPSPRLLGFTLTAALLLILGVAVLLCAETVAWRPGLMRSLVPRVHVPAGAGRALLSTGFALLATWSFSGFYQAFAPGLTADYLGTSDALMVAVVFSSIVVLSPRGDARHALPHLLRRRSASRPRRRPGVHGLDTSRCRDLLRGSGRHCSDCGPGHQPQTASEGGPGDQGPERQMTPRQPGVRPVGCNDGSSLIHARRRSLDLEGTIPFPHRSSGGIT